MGHLHLTVLHSVSGDADPTQATLLASPRRHEFVWNADFTAFRIVPLKWWDDASYIAFELDAVDTGALAELEYQRLHPELAPPAPAPVAAQPEEDDGLLF